jgi:uncharacterized protein (DUF924 family)
MLYMPLLHAEDADMQKKSVEKFTELHEWAKANSRGLMQLSERFVTIAHRHEKVSSFH